MRIAAQIMIGQHVLIHGIAVGVAEPVVPVVAIAAVLRHAGLRIEQALVGPDAEVATVGVHHVARLAQFDLPILSVAMRAVDPAVESPLEPVDAMLRIALDESVIEHFAFVGLAVAVGVLGVENVGSARDQNAIAPRHHAIRKAQVVEKHGRAIVAPVAVDVFQISHAAAVPAVAIDAARIVAHLGHPERPSGPQAMAIGSITNGSLAAKSDLEARPRMHKWPTTARATSVREIARLRATHRAAAGRPGRAASPCLRSARTDSDRGTMRHCSCRCERSWGWLWRRLAGRPRAVATSLSRVTRTSVPSNPIRSRRKRRDVRPGRRRRSASPRRAPRSWTIEVSAGSAYGSLRQPRWPSSAKTAR